MFVNAWNWCKGLNLGPKVKILVKSSILNDTYKSLNGGETRFLKFVICCLKWRWHECSVFFEIKVKKVVRNRDILWSRCLQYQCHHLICTRDSKTCYYPCLQFRRNQPFILSLLNSALDSKFSFCSFTVVDY